MAVEVFWVSLLVALLSAAAFDAANTTSAIGRTVPAHHLNHHQHQHHHNGHNNSKIKPHEIWAEVNETIMLNCSLRINKEHHIVWHRKYDNLGVHVLTIESMAFISDLRMRPIRYEFKNDQPVSTLYSSSSAKGGSADFVSVGSKDSDKFYTYNLEIRRLRRDDTALYYCVLNSENTYGQFYKLNVLPQLRILNKTDIKIDASMLRSNDHGAKKAAKPVKHQMENTLYSINNYKAADEDERRKDKSDPWYTMQNDSGGDADDWAGDEGDDGVIRLVCKYDDLLLPSQDESGDHHQIKWYLNKMRIRPRLVVGSAATSTSVVNAPSSSSTAGAGAANHSNSAAYSLGGSPAVELSQNNFRVQQMVSHETNTTLSVLSIRNFNMRAHLGKYKCQYRGLHKTVRLYSSQVIQSSHHSNKGKENLKSRSKVKSGLSRVADEAKKQPSRYSSILNSENDPAEAESEDEHLVDQNTSGGVDKYVMESAGSGSESSFRIGSSGLLLSAALVIFFSISQRLLNAAAA